MTPPVSPKWSSNQMIFPLEWPSYDSLSNNLPLYLKRYAVQSIMKSDQKIRISDCQLFSFSKWEDKAVTPYQRKKAESTVVKINKALESGHYVIGRIDLIIKHNNSAVDPIQIENRFKVTFYKSMAPFTVPSGKKFKEFMDENISTLSYDELQMKYEDVGGAWFLVNNEPEK